MTAVAEIIEGAFYEAGLVTELQHATPTQTNKAMETLAGLINFLYGSNVGEYLQPWPLGNFGRSNDSKLPFGEDMLRRPFLNANLVATNENAITVYLPVNPSDGARVGLIDPFGRLATAPVTIDGNGRTIGGAATQVMNVSGTTAIWFFRGDTGNWVRVTPLLITDEMPFPIDYDEMFKIMLAMRLNPVYGKNVSSVQAQFLKEFRQQFTARYVQSAPLEVGTDLSFMSMQSYDNFSNAWVGNDTSAWNRGGGWGWW